MPKVHVRPQFEGLFRMKIVGAPFLARLLREKREWSHLFLYFVFPNLLCKKAICFFKRSALCSLGA
jgi:uncharacterized membrane protein YcfT